MKSPLEIVSTTSILPMNRPGCPLSPDRIQSECTSQKISVVWTADVLLLLPSDASNLDLVMDVSASAGSRQQWRSQKSLLELESMPVCPDARMPILSSCPDVGKQKGAVGLWWGELLCFWCVGGERVSGEIRAACASRRHRQRQRQRWFWRWRNARRGRCGDECASE